MNPITASALRRAAVAGGALGASLAGHMLTVDGWRILPVAPFLWLGLVALTIVTAGRRHGDLTFTAWGPARVLLVLVAGQVAFLRTLTDRRFLTDPKLSNPFRVR